MKFEKITLDCMPRLLPYLKCEQGGLCDYTAGTIYMWAGICDYSYAICDGVLIIRSVVGGETKYYVPCGNFAEAAKIMGEGTVFAPVDEAQALPFGGREIEGFFDYVYTAEDLAELKGKRYHSKRNYVNTFRNTYPDYGYHAITPENAGKVKDFLRRFDMSAFGTVHRLEHLATIDALDNLAAINSFGAYIEVGDNIVAMTVGEISGDTLFVHSEKADTSFRGAYEIINCEFVRHWADKVKFVNREEDMGDPGMRAAKESYHPVKLLPKYEVRLKKSDLVND